jgi:hypothetical protein
MPDGTSISPKLLRGALVRIGEPFVGPVPNVIVFQYNPDGLSRTLTPWQPPPDKASDAQNAGSADTAQPYDPGESFNLVLELDATDALEHPESHPVAVLAGVADRIAALEQLLYPEGGDGDLIGGAISSLGGLFGGGGATAVTPRSQVPIVLFAWGPGRIVPVRLTSFQVEEQAFLPTLYPLRAKVTVGLQILGPAFYAARRAAQKGTLSTAESIAEAAYKYTRGQKDLLARANVANSVESVLGMLPF